MFLLVFAIRTLRRIGDGYLLSHTSEHIVASLRRRVYDHLQSLSLGYHHDRRRGDVLSLLTQDMDSLSGYITGTLVSIAPMVLTFLGAWKLMLRIDLVIAGAVGLLVALFFVIVESLSR